MPLICAIAMVLAGQSSGQSSASRDNRLCGPYCLFVASVALGADPGRFEDFVASLGPPAADGYSMAQLEQAAGKLGLKTMGVRTRIESLGRVHKPFACIALMDKHFALIQDIDETGGMIAVLDPPDRRTIPIDTFSLEYSGSMLLLSPTGIVFRPELPWKAVGIAGIVLAVPALLLLFYLRIKRGRHWGRTAIASGLIVGLILPLATIAGCDGRNSASSAVGSGTKAVSRHTLRVEPPVVDLGSILVDSPVTTVEGKVQLWNDRTEPIRITSVTKRCECTTLLLDKPVILPSSSAQLTARIKVGDQPGPRQTMVTVVCEDRSIPDQDILFTWETKTRLFTDSQSSNLGRLVKGVQETRRFPLRLRAMSLCPDCRLTAESNHGLLSASASLAPVPAGRSHDVSRSLQGADAAEIGYLEVAIASESDPGDYSGGVAVELHCGSAVRTSSFVPVSWSVRAPIEAMPPRLSLGVCAPGQIVEREVSLTSSLTRPFSITGVSCEPSSILINSQTDRGERIDHKVRLGFRMDVSQGLGRGKLTIKVTGKGLSDSQLVVPVSFIVRGSSK